MLMYKNENAHKKAHDTIFFKNWYFTNSQAQSTVLIWDPICNINVHALIVSGLYFDVLYK